MRAGNYAPPLILNSHCKVCRFSSHCRTKAVDKDDLSLISSLSAKEILKLNKKGIFSVTQLSYTYRAPRSRRKSETIEKHSPALKALAIRENKIYITSADKPQMGRVQIFLDIEGIPDKDFYYLIGAKVIDGMGPMRRVIHFGRIVLAMKKRYGSSFSL
jgi:predicted RecB family nuclease